MVIVTHTRQTLNLTRILTSFLRIVPSSKTVVQCQCHRFGNYRALMNFADYSNRTKEFSGRQLVGFTMEQMYEVVSDVGNYNHFVPWCTRSIIIMSKEDHLKAKLSVGFPPISESYTSHVTLFKPHLVKAECKEGRLFKHMLTLWRFSPGLKREPQSCVVDFHITFEFRSTFHSQLSHMFFDHVVKQMQGAFLTEVKRRCGTPKLETRNLPIPELDKRT